MSIIDRGDQIEAIKRKYGERYWHNLEAHAEASAVWGLKANDCGVVGVRGIELIAQSNRCTAKMRYAITPEGHCLISMDYQTPISGSSGPISVWDRFAYSTKKDALDAAVKATIAYFEANAGMMNSCVGAAEREDSRRIVAALSQQYAQPSLF